MWKLSLDGECVYLLRTLDCKKKTSTPRERPLTKKTGWGTTERERERWPERERKREGGCSALWKRRIKNETALSHEGAAI